jgi:hypothetical protein
VWRTAFAVTSSYVVHRWLAGMVIAGLVSVMVGGLAVAGSGSSGARAAEGAVKLFTPRGKPLPGRWQFYADSSRVPTILGRVTIRIARCPALPRAAGCVYSKRPRTIYIRPGIPDPRGVLLHELGHSYDLTVMNNRDRGRFRRIMRAPKRKWWAGAHPLAEQFAEAYSWCARYARIVSITRYSSYRYRPTPRQHKRICRLIVRVAGDRAPSERPPDTPVVTRPHAPPAPPPSTAPGVVPGDPERDPGPQEPENPSKPPPKPTPTPTPRPKATPTPTPRPVPVPVPTSTPTPRPVPTVIPLP